MDNLTCFLDLLPTQNRDQLPHIPVCSHSTLAESILSPREKILPCFKLLNLSSAPFPSLLQAPLSNSMKPITLPRDKSSKGLWVFILLFFQLLKFIPIRSHRKFLRKKFVSLTSVNIFSVKLVRTEYSNQEKLLGISLVVQWLRFHVPNAGLLGLIPGQGTRSRILQLRPGTAKLINKNKF